MDYMTAKEVSVLWGISKRRVTSLCEAGRIKNAYKLGGNWILPKGTEKPADMRIKTGRYVKPKGGFY